MTEPTVQEEILLASYVTQRRIYDTLYVLLDHLSPDDADALRSLHEEGRFATPPPKMVAEND